MPIKIAIPEPTSTDAEYNARSLPPYIAALRSSGAVPVVVPLHERQDRVAHLLAGTQGVLLPGSRFDVDPERYGQARLPECGPTDPARSAVDELLLQDAFNLRKPILAICHGMQTLNVWLNGTLIQDLPSQGLPQDLPSQDLPAGLGPLVNHAPGRHVIDAHAIHVETNSILGGLARERNAPVSEQVNSSHHQAIGLVGDRLIASATSAEDGVVEAVELSMPGPWVLGVQWHPERTYAAKPLSRAIFQSFVQAAANWREVQETVAEAAGK